MRPAALGPALLLVLGMAGCNTIGGLLKSGDGPETKIRNIPAKYSGVESYYEEIVLSVAEGGKAVLEGARLQVTVQHPGKFKLDASGPEDFRLVSDGTSFGVQAAGESKLSLQPLPDPLRFYNISGMLDRYQATPYLAQSLVLPWVFREMESQADLLVDLQSGVEVGTYWGEECTVHSYGDEAVKRLWRGKERADGGELRVWVHQYENKVVREEWVVRLAESHKEVRLTFQHRNVRLDAVLEPDRFALDALPLKAAEAVTAKPGTADPAGDAGGAGTAVPVGGAGQEGLGVVVAAEKPELPAGPRGVALGALIELLKHPTPEYATAAAAVLHLNGRAEGVKCLAEWVRSRRPRWVLWAARAAADVKEKSLKEGLQADVTIPDGVARVWVYRALYALGDVRQLNELEGCLKTPDVDVQIEATQAIIDVGGRAVLDTLVVNLGDAEADLRVWSAHALGELADGRAREALEQALGADSDSGVRLEAALALRKIADPRSREVLSKALVEDPHRPVRLQAAGGLAKLGAREAFDFILAMLKSGYPDARREAILVLGALVDPAAAQPLQAFVTGDPAPPDAEQEEAAIALGKIGGEATTETLRRLLSYDGERVRLRAAEALARAKDPAADAVLLKLAGSTDPEVALAAAKALLR